VVEVVALVLAPPVVDAIDSSPRSLSVDTSVWMSRNGVDRSLPLLRIRM
jgi:hypothetical protein